MKQRFKKVIAVTLGLVLVLSVVGCESNNQAEAQSYKVTELDEHSLELTNNMTAGFDLEFSASDLSSDWDNQNATTIKLANNQTEITGEGATVQGNSVAITAGGTYILSGSYNNGQVKVEVPNDTKVQLVFQGVTLANAEQSPLYIAEADKVFLTLAEGSSNTLSGCNAYSSEAQALGMDGVIFSKADLCLNGTGSLSLTAPTESGIVSKDDLIITGGNYQITAAKEALKGKDCVKIAGGSFDLQAGEDGIKSTNNEDSNRGFIYLADGSFNIKAQQDGLQAETLLEIDQGSLNILTSSGSGSESAKANSQSNRNQMAPPQGFNSAGTNMMNPNSAGTAPKMTFTSSGANPGMLPNSSANFKGGQGGRPDQAQTETNEDTVSTKALKANNIYLKGGSFNLDSLDDAFHANQNMVVNDGNYTIKTGDDAFHVDNELIFNGGTIQIDLSYEGLEGSKVTINGGKISLTSTDDGINAAGDDGTGLGGQDRFANASDSQIVINGGYVSVKASGDGLDSNGTMVFNGGTTLISTLAQGDNDSLDCEGGIYINGGTIIAAGSFPMFHGVSEESQQNSLLYQLSQTQTAGTRVSLVDSQGQALLSALPEQAYAAVFFSSERIELEQTYQIEVGGELANDTLTGSNIDGEIQASSVYTSNATNNRMPGGMGGGRNGKPNNQMPSAPAN